MQPWNNASQTAFIPRFTLTSSSLAWCIFRLFFIRRPWQIASASRYSKRRVHLLKHRGRTAKCFFSSCRQDFKRCILCDDALLMIEDKERIFFCEKWNRAEWGFGDKKCFLGRTILASRFACITGRWNKSFPNSSWKFSQTRVDDAKRFDIRHVRAQLYIPGWNSVVWLTIIRNAGNECGGRCRVLKIPHFAN